MDLPYILSIFWHLSDPSAIYLYVIQLKEVNCLLTPTLGLVIYSLGFILNIIFFSDLKKSGIYWCLLLYYISVSRSDFIMFSQ